MHEFLIFAEVPHSAISPVGPMDASIFPGDRASRPNIPSSLSSFHPCSHPHILTSRPTSPPLYSTSILRKRRIKSHESVMEPAAGIRELTDHSTSSSSSCDRSDPMLRGCRPPWPSFATLSTIKRIVLHCDQLANAHYRGRSASPLVPYWLDHRHTASTGIITL